MRARFCSTYQSARSKGRRRAWTLLANTFVVFTVTGGQALAIDNHGSSPPVLYYNPSTGSKTPFFPIGWYAFGPSNSTDILGMRVSGANTVLLSSIPDGLQQIQETRAALDTLQSYGMKAVVMTRPSIMTGVNPSQPATYATLQALVDGLKEHPALLAWELGDELPGSEVTLQDLRNTATVVKTLDPNRQLWQNFHAGFSNSTVATWMLNSTNVLSLDDYKEIQGAPQFSGSAAYLNNSSRFGTLAAGNQQWPFVQVTQGFGGYSNYRLPTAGEYRWNVLAPIASSGARAMLNWVYSYGSDWYANPNGFFQFRSQVVQPVFTELRTLQHAMETGYGVGGVAMNWDGKALDDAGTTWDESFDRFSQVLLYDDAQAYYYLVVTNNASDVRQFQATISTLPIALRDLFVTIPKTGQVFALTDLGSGSYRLADSLLDHQPVIYRLNAIVTTGAWNVNANGNWSVAGNWMPGVPNGAGVVANFASVITAPRTVTVDSAQTVGTINFDDANKYTIAGTATLTLDNTAASVAINVTSGTHAVTAPVVLAKNATFTVVPAASTLTVSNLQSSSVDLTKAGAGALAINSARATSLTINAGTVSILTNGGNAGTSKIATLTIAGGATPNATLDLNDNDLVTATSKAMIEAQVKNARNGGGWNQPGITSAVARSLATTGLGVLSGAEYSSVGGTGTFGGQSYAATDTLVKYTWNGDANFSGTITFDDYVKIDTGFNASLTGWANGDFNYSGGVTFDDYVLIDVAFNAQGGTLSRAVDYISGDDRTDRGLDEAGVAQVIQHFGQFGAPYGSAFLAAIPEPGCAAYVVLGAAVLCGVRRRRTTGARCD